MAPEPDQPFIQLAQAVWEKFPDSPPYDGAHDRIIPHQTFAQIEDKTNAKDSVRNSWHIRKEDCLGTPLPVMSG